jgi:antitoxin VapB
MALNIKDPATDRLARELACLSGESITIALHRAIEMRLVEERARRRVSHVRQSLAELIQRGRVRATLDHRSAEKILGFDGAGLPT